MVLVFCWFMVTLPTTEGLGYGYIFDAFALLMVPPKELFFFFADAVHS